MRNQTNHALEQSPELLGDWHPLLEQLGSAEGLVTLQAVAQTLQLPRVQSWDGLVRFLECYRDRILLPLELPVIYRACSHAARHELRELLALDAQAGPGAFLKEFASASLRVGRAGLKRLRPLRDERLVQRYLRAVEAGEAHGWHTIVYGMTLAVYSWPVRQGLLHYASTTLAGFLHPIARRLDVTESTGRQLINDICAPLPPALDLLLANDSSFRADRRA